ncbi:6911_t:CDS:2, partial [Scutellospora calospora]
YTLERLQKHSNVSQVIENGMAVICICRKRITLKSKYNKSYLDSHVNRPGCNRSKGIRAITEFFVPAEKTVIPEQKHIFCKGLHEDIHINYIERVQFISLYSDALRKETIARSMFSDLFSENTSVRYALLNKDQREQLNEAERMQAKWKIEEKAIYAQLCETYTSNISEVCNQCISLNTDQVFHNALNKRPPVRENKKFIPKAHLSSHSLSNYLSNPDIAMLVSLTKSDESQPVSFWKTLAKIGECSAFHKKRAFEGLCEVMVEIAKRHEAGKGLQNLTYLEKFSDFISILASLSPRAYNLFRQNLAGKTIQNIRYKIIKFKYQTCVQNHDDIYTIVDKIQTKNAIASQVRVYLLQIPISKFPPSVIALIPNYGKENAEDIFNIHQNLLQIAAQLKLSILAFGADEIRAIIHQVFKHSKILTEDILNMATISFQFYNPLIFDDENNSDEILNNINSNQESLDNIINIENVFISVAATEINNDNWELPDSSNSDYEEGRLNLSFISQSLLNSTISIISDILDNESFIKINDINNEKYEAYTSQSIERRISRNQSQIPEKLNSNYTQSLVAYLSSNETSRP